MGIEMLYLCCPVGTSAMYVYCETQKLEFNLANVAMATYCIIQCCLRTACSKCLYSQRSIFGTKCLPHDWPGICSPYEAIVRTWKNSKGGI